MYASSGFCYLLNMIFFSGSINCPEKLMILFFFTTEYYSIFGPYFYNPFLGDRTFTSCNFLDIKKMSTMNMIEQVSLGYDVEAFWYMLRNGVTGQYGRLTFIFQKIIYTDFHDGYTNLQFIYREQGFPFPHMPSGTSYQLFC